MAATKTKQKGAGQGSPDVRTAADKVASKAPVKAKPAGKSASDAKKAKDAKAKRDAKPGAIAKATGYFKNVRTEVKRVVWPTKDELVKYTAAVVGMLVFFGVLIAVVDSLVLPALYAFSGLRG